MKAARLKPKTKSLGRVRQSKHQAERRKRHPEDRNAIKARQGQYLICRLCSPPANFAKQQVGSSREHLEASLPPLTGRLLLTPAGHPAVVPAHAILSWNAERVCFQANLTTGRHGRPLLAEGGMRTSSSP